MLKMEMNVGKLKQELADLPDDMPVYVSCEGYCNYNKIKRTGGTDTYAIVKNDKLFITDEVTVEVDGENL